MQKPAQDKSGRHGEKYQQRTGHRESPVQKSDFHYVGILGDKEHRHAGEQNYQYQFQIHLSGLLLS
ncbi:MAG: hypothetical protein Q8J80_11625 [Gallionella sp.]|nr:hypothetical protein [Gallionella sp.]